MYIPNHHSWDLSRDRARRIQESLASEVVLEDDLTDIRTVAGIVISYPRTASGAITGRAAVLVASMPDLHILEQCTVQRQVTFPHIPGLLSFREAPVALAALEQLSVQPDVLMVESSGAAQPNTLSVASHLGVLLDMPTIWCTKSMPAGRAVNPPDVAGSWTRLDEDRKPIGVALRTQSGRKPMHVRPGHRISLETALAIVMQCTRSSRLPEPIRLAGLQIAQQPGVTATP